MAPTSIDRTTLLFFDASSLVAAAGRPVGGSGFLLSLVRRQLLVGAISGPVIEEAERNIRAKMRPEAFTRFQELLHVTSLRITRLPDEAAVRRFYNLVGEKDAHVIAAALTARAAYLITLDHPLAERISGSGLPIQALTPGVFITTVLPTHPEYPVMRDR